nr:MAG TPA: hypothetical protein [Caudoviricetes sp.]
MSLTSISKEPLQDLYKSKKMYTYIHIQVKIPCKISACKLIIYSTHKPLTTIYSIHSHIIRYNTTIYCML